VLALVELTSRFGASDFQIAGGSQADSLTFPVRHIAWEPSRSGRSDASVCAGNPQEQERQWRLRSEFEVVGCDTGTRYKLTSRASMNILQLELPIAQCGWVCDAIGGLVLGHALLPEDRN
jgi:hypothetical protein